MDIRTYRFTKKTFFHETKKTNVPEEIKDIVEWIKDRGFILQSINNPQTISYSKEVMEGSYVVELDYDLGEEKCQFLIVKIIKNKWTNWQIEWWFMLDEIEDNWLGKGNNLEELKEKITDYLKIMRRKENRRLED